MNVETLKLFPWEIIDHLIQLALEEDLGATGDITTDSTVPQTVCGKAKLISKAEGTLAGLPVFERVFDNLSAKQIELKPFKKDGDHLKKSDIVAELNGPLYHILRSERIALNFLQHCSGVATQTSQFVQAIRGNDCKILDTRKTTPGFRWLDKYAVRQGGGYNHRTGLFDMVLIKDNHIESAGGIDAVLTQCLDFLEKSSTKVNVEIEVKNIDELKTALKYPINRIMLDNMDVTTMKQAVDLVKGKVELEASGNVTLETIRSIAETGVDVISVGALTHSALAFDFSLLVEISD